MEEEQPEHIKQLFKGLNKKQVKNLKSVLNCLTNTINDMGYKGCGIKYYPIRKIR